jgi:hypothetical protein
MAASQRLRERFFFQEKPRTARRTNETASQTTDRGDQSTTNPESPSGAASSRSLETAAGAIIASIVPSSPGDSDRPSAVDKK